MPMHTRGTMAITALHMFPLYPPIVTNGLNTKGGHSRSNGRFSRLVTPNTSPRVSAILRSKDDRSDDDQDVDDRCVHKALTECNRETVRPNHGDDDRGENPGEGHVQNFLFNFHFFLFPPATALFRDTMQYSHVLHYSVSA